MDPTNAQAAAVLIFILGSGCMFAGAFIMGYWWALRDVQITAEEDEEAARRMAQEEILKTIDRELGDRELSISDTELLETRCTAHDALYTNGRALTLHKGGRVTH